MSLIKLTAVPNPDVDEGRPAAVYLDATRILMITRSSVQFTKQGSVDRHRELYDTLYGAAQKLSDQVGNYIPSMTDPVAVEWMTRARDASCKVNDAFSVWGKAYAQPEMHPRVMCTEIQLACGTALEHGVMLARVWVTETPEEVKNLIEDRVYPRP